MRHERDGVLLLPPLRRVFQFGPLHLDDLAISTGLTLILVLALMITGRLGVPSPRPHPQPDGFR